MTTIVSGSSITFNDNTTQNTSAYGGGFAFRNRIINGGMVIDQRNAGASVTLTPSAPYTVDRWLGLEDTDGGMTAQQDSSAPTGFNNSLKFTTTSADSSLSAAQTCRMQQHIEGFNIADLGWGTANAKTVTLSFWVRSSLTGTFAGGLRNYDANRGYPFNYTISAANTWEYKTITVAGDTTGTWNTTNSGGIAVIFDLGSGSNYQSTVNTWGAGNYFSTSGATSVIGTNGATWYITGVQLEKGSTATSFDYRPYGTELALCQRYYVKYALPVNTGAGASPLGTAVSTTLVDGYIIPSVPFRVSASSLSLTVSSLQIYTVSSASAFSTGTWAIPYDTNSLFVTIRYTHGSAVFTQGASQLIVGNGTTGFLALSAEL